MWGREASGRVPREPRERMVETCRDERVGAAAKALSSASDPSPRPRRGRGAASRRTGGPTRRASGRNASLAIGYGATRRPWASAAGKVVGSGRGATSPRSHSEPNIDVASDGSRRAVRFDEPGHRLGRRRREAARGVGYVGCPGELTYLGLSGWITESPMAMRCSIGYCLFFHIT